MFRELADRSSMRAVWTAVLGVEPLVAAVWPWSLLALLVLSLATAGTVRQLGRMGPARRRSSIAARG